MEDLSFSSYRSRELLEAEINELRRKNNSLSVRLNQEKSKTSELRAKNERLIAQLIELNAK